MILKDSFPIRASSSGKNKVDKGRQGVNIHTFHITLINFMDTKRPSTEVADTGAANVTDAPRPYKRTYIATTSPELRVSTGYSQVLCNLTGNGVTEGKCEGDPDCVNTVIGVRREIIAVLTGDEQIISIKDVPEDKQKMLQATDGPIRFCGTHLENLMVNKKL